MTVAISNGIIILLFFLQNTYAQQGVNNAVSQSKVTCNTAGVNFNSAQPGQQISWQQPSNTQQQSQNYQQSGTSQVKQNSLSDIFSALQNLRFSTQKPGANPPQSSGYKQTFDQPQSNQLSPVSNNQQNPQYANQVTESQKPSFTFQFVPVSQNMVPENQMMQNTVPVQFLANGQNQMAAQAGPSYYTQNQPNGVANQQVAVAQTTNSGQSQPLVFTMNSQQPSCQSQPMVYTLQSAQSSRPVNQQTTPQTVQPNMADNPIALLMSQLQSPSAKPDIASLLPMLMNSKQEKSGGMKAMLPLILSLLIDKGCGCPHCGCPYNSAEPTINGGYSNQMNYSLQGLTDTTKTSEATTAVATKEESRKGIVREQKKYKTNEISDSDISEEVSEEDDEEYEYDDD